MECCFCTHEYRFYQMILERIIENFICYLWQVEMQALRVEVENREQKERNVTESLRKENRDLISTNETLKENINTMKNNSDKVINFQPECLGQNVNK